MKQTEFFNILSAVIILTLISGLSYIINEEFSQIPIIFLFSAIVISISVLSKKIMAHLLDSDVEHKIWMFKRFGVRPNQHLKKEMPAGIIFPLLFSIITLGIIKFGALLTYESKALKYRAAKRFGYYSFTEMTEWHNALIGTAGIVSLLIVSILGYFSGFEELARLSAFYAISNILPFSNLDGAQIFFGSRVLYITLGIITLVFFTYALII